MAYSKYCGPTKGNSDLPPNRSTGGMPSAAPESGPKGGKFIGETKGNRDLKPNRSSGVQTGQAGKFIAGRRKAY